MSDNPVVPLRDDVLIPGQRNERVIEFLEGLMAKAEAGEIAAIGVAWVSPTGRPHQSWAHTEAIHGWLLPTTVQVLLLRMLDEIKP